MAATRNLLSRPKHNMWLRKAGKREPRQINFLSRIRIAKRQPTSLQSNSHETLKEMILYLGKSKQKLCFDVRLQKTSKFFSILEHYQLAQKLYFSLRCSRPTHSSIQGLERLRDCDAGNFIWILKKIGHKKEKKRKPGIRFIHYWDQVNFYTPLGNCPPTPPLSQH